MPLREVELREPTHLLRCTMFTVKARALASNLQEGMDAASTESARGVELHFEQWSVARNAREANAIRCAEIA